MPRQGPHHDPESTTKPGNGNHAAKPGNGTHLARHNALAETLWEHLREGRCDGFRFRRQATVLEGTAHFYCAAAKLAVQVVGLSRLSDRREEARNEQVLAGGGLRVLRVPASVVARDPRAASRLVAEALMESGHAPGPARDSKYHFGPGPVGDVW